MHGWSVLQWKQVMKPSDHINTDPIFSDIRLARIYDDFDGDRNDLIPYIKIVKDFKANSAIDLGCGTGSLAILLEKEGINVTGVDPAKASIDVAQSKPNAGKIEWLIGDASVLPTNTADIVIMTGNVAQAIIEPAQWGKTLDRVAAALNESGRFIFETRNPDFQAWKKWNKEASFQSLSVAGIGLVDGWVELMELNFPFVSFRWTYFFHEDNVTLTSNSTLGFRTISELRHDLTSHGFQVEDIREAPDRPGQEHVVIAKYSKVKSG